MNGSAGSGQSVNARLSRSQESREGKMSARFCGVLTCGHIWTCPTCSARLPLESFSRSVNAAVSNAGGTWDHS